MQGTIRIILGLLLMVGAAGGVDNATDGQLVIIALIAAGAGAMMYSGVRALNGQAS